MNRMFKEKGERIITLTTHDDRKYTEKGDKI